MDTALKRIFMKSGSRLTLCILVITLGTTSFAQPQRPLINVNWIWFYETSALLFNGFSVVEQEAAQNAIKNHTAEITELDKRLADISLLLNTLSETQGQFMQFTGVAPADLVYLQLSLQSLHTGISALKESFDKINNKLTSSDQRALILLAKNSFIAHQLSFTLFSQQAVESVQR
jgi:hypothetical protein